MQKACVSATIWAPARSLLRLLFELCAWRACILSSACLSDFLRSHFCTCFQRRGTIFCLPSSFRPLLFSSFLLHVPNPSYKIHHRSSKFNIQNWRINHLLSKGIWSREPVPETETCFFCRRFIPSFGAGVHLLTFFQVLRPPLFHFLLRVPNSSSKIQNRSSKFNTQDWSVNL